jgi:hypothetical protein
MSSLGSARALLALVALTFLNPTSERRRIDICMTLERDDED